MRKDHIARSKRVNRANPSRTRLFALVFVIAAFGCSRASPPAPTTVTSAASSPTSAPHAPGKRAAQGSTAPEAADPPQALPPTAPPASASPAATARAGSAPTPPPSAAPASQARASLWTKPQNCSVYDTSPDYRGLSAQDRAHGRLTCETKEEFRAFVASHQACKADSDCAIMSGSCPFGCYVPTAKGGEREVRAKLDSLGARLDKAGNRCTYNCLGSPEVACVDGRCDAGNR